MSTSYSIYRFAKPTKYELAGIDYFSEYDSFYLHDSDGEQTTGYIMDYTDGEQIKQIKYDDLQFYEMIVQTECIAIKMECLWNSDEVYSYIDKKRVWENIPTLEEYRFVPVSNNILAKAEISFLIFERNRGKCFIEAH